MDIIEIVNDEPRQKQIEHVYQKVLPHFSRYQRTLMHTVGIAQGYCMTDIASDGHFFLNLGGPKAGKSTDAALMVTMLGPLAGTCPESVYIYVEGPQRQAGGPSPHKRVFV